MGAILAAIPWGVIFDVGLRLIDLLIQNQDTKNKLKIQMYEFARRFDIEAVDNNAKHREEYKRLKDLLAKEEEERQKNAG